MKYEKVYNLSKRFGPPNWNLRSAELADEWGDGTHAKRPIDHKVPEDVSREDFDYYGSVYFHMEVEDLLFYLYPIAIEYSKDKSFDVVEDFVAALNCKLSEKIDVLTEEDIEALKEGVDWIFHLHDINDEEWFNCYLGKELLDKR